MTPHGKAPRWLLLLLASFLLTGCGSDWMIGKWEFDEEATLQSLGVPDEAEPEEAGLLNSVISGLQKGFSHLLISQLKGTEIEFTDSEMRRIRSGSGEAIGYEVIEKPDADTRLIKFDDGEINTLKRTDSGIGMLLPENEDAWIHFKPAEE